MGRFLTPAKIGLLALVELYVDELVPTSAIIPVLSFITSSLLDREPTVLAPSCSSSPQSRWTNAERRVSLVTSINDFESLLAAYPVVVGLPGRKLWDIFLEKLWDVNSLHQLHDFFDRQSHNLVMPSEQLRRLGLTEAELQGIRISRNSPFGTFIRRCQLEFTRLRFEDSVELWKDFVSYRQPTLGHRQRRSPSMGRMSFDYVLDAGEQADWDVEAVNVLASITYGDSLTSNSSSSLPVSTDDVEFLLEFQIDKMQTHGNRVPLDVRVRFQRLLQDSRVIPTLSHYLSFLDAWKSGDHPTAFDYLHRYFDYTMQSRERLYYQYALMNLAIIQADFGSHKDALETMLETVSTARENQDMPCLNFALNWLFQFGRAHPRLIRDLESDSLLGSGKESLAYLRAKAKETGMWPLWSSVLLSEAKLGFCDGESVASCVEMLVRSSQLIVTRNLKNLYGAQLTMAMALWERLGLAHLSAVESEIFLRCHIGHTSFDDELKVTARVAMHLTERGKYDQALKMVEALDENALRSWKASQYWYKYRGIIKLTRDLRHDNLDAAEQLMSQLLQSKQDDMEPDVAFVINSLHVDYLMRRGDLQAAFSKVEDMLDALDDGKRDIALYVHLMLLKAQLFDKAGRPQRGFTLAMRAASTAWRARLIPTLWQASGALASILSSLGEFDAAAQLLTAVLPRSLEYESAAMSGQLYSHLADANMGLAGKAPPNSARRTEHLTRAASAVEKAFDSYSAIEDTKKQCEMMAKKATIMKVAGDKALAADYAAAYVSLRKSAAALATC
ncbi:anaphase-promoting complex protein [Sodiomyces alkalinus F11]|uniref:Anaphase-promoting complex subunit 5 n=1 Tax=Sodiomyces alkalinus (strain CBS 110278 / VKM F-3762 / F11) TaxID=1314773 RepID=A0A3N2Q4S2_SODAK|nr:anaphase-promoting complex protein [Sodiomyces alkalinus F11]ROT41697.1 anaphase-promoting complex protein [Sodiomyces alkalinus F11]